MVLTRYTIATAVIAVTFAALTGSPIVARQQPNPRFGVWKLKSTAPPPSSNLMTYEAYNGTGMKITIDAVSASGTKSQWGYTTMFDGKDEAMVGNAGADSASVKVLNDRVNEMIYKKGGVVTQVLANILSPDHDTIDVVYVRFSPDGKMTGMTTATYERQK